MTSRLTEEIERYRGSSSNPPHSDDGMDFERCAALHNAIVRQGWVARGHDLSALPESTYCDRWSPTLTPYQSESLRERLHPSVLAFLERALALPDFYPGSFEPPVFFYHLVGLNAPLELFANHEEVEEDRYVTLYCLHGALATEGRLPDGLVYDQVQHKCALIKDIEEGATLPLEECQLRWQPLESVLITYCEMIETDKVVALPKTVKGPEPFEYVRNPAGGYAMREVPDHELRDPRTGARRTSKTFDPWVVVPFTQQDVKKALSAWHRLLELVEGRMGKRKWMRLHCREKMYSTEVLEKAGLRRNGFAFGFLSQATKPLFSNVAPGLRLLDEKEFLQQPLQVVTLKRRCSTPSILLFRSDTPLDTEYGQDSGDDVPAGLYLERCDEDEAFPFENVVRGSLNTQRELKSWLSRMCPFVQSDEFQVFPHPNQLHMVLKNFGNSVERGLWSVGPNGIEKDIVEVWEESDMQPESISPES